MGDVGEAVSFDPLWKLKLRYGRLTTPFKHFVVIADGVPEDGQTENTRGFLSISAWALDSEQVERLLHETAGAIGFQLDGRAYHYSDVEPKEPPRSAPHVYHSKVHRYPADQREDDDVDEAGQQS